MNSVGLFCSHDSATPGTGFILGSRRTKPSITCPKSMIAIWSSAFWASIILGSSRKLSAIALRSASTAFTVADLESNFPSADGAVAAAVVAAGAVSSGFFVLVQPNDAAASKRATMPMLCPVARKLLPLNINSPHFMIS